MRIEHAALYVRDLEGAKAFFQTFFGGCAGERYHNPRTGFSSYFLTFEEGARLELMTRPGVEEGPAPQTFQVGYAHLAFSLGSREAVDALTSQLSQAGWRVTSGPRVTGDGYYESCVVGPEGILVELTV